MKIVQLGNILTIEDVGRLTIHLYEQYSEWYVSLSSTEEQLTLTLTDEVPTDIEEEIIALCSNYRLEYPKISDLVTLDLRGKDFRSINYKTELIKSLHPSRVFSRGELGKVEWFSDSDLTDLILQVEMEYTRDSLGFALHRITTRSWMNKSGNFHINKKVTIKKYSDLEQIAEGKTRRGNIIDGLQKPILGMMLATVIADDGESETERQTRIIMEGRTFLATHKAKFTLFVEDSNREIYQEILNATEYWLDNNISETMTIRDYILNELNIGGIA